MTAEGPPPPASPAMSRAHRAYVIALTGTTCTRCHQGAKR